MAAALLLAGCSHSPTAPAVSSGASPAATAAADVPDFSDVQVRFADGFLHLEAAPATPWAAALFDPRRPGGWCFQLFINADQSGTGYGPGIDYLVRAIEITPGGGVDVRLAEGGGGPGGWGAAVGRVVLDVRGGLIECAIPLEILGPDDGAIDFALETYRTVALPPEKGGGVKHEFVANYSGTSAPYGRNGPSVRRGLVAVAPEANRAY
jgi:hypothetical protein